MLRNYRIVSGEFLLVLKEENSERAATEAIRLHYESNHHSLLGEITMVESNSKKESTKFFSTQNILDEVSYDSLQCNVSTSRF